MGWLQRVFRRPMHHVVGAHEEFVHDFEDVVTTLAATLRLLKEINEPALAGELAHLFPEGICQQNVEVLGLENECLLWTNDLSGHGKEPPLYSPTFGTKDSSN